jgi:tetratricopeptide (TPR) repeat protein
VEYIVDRYGLPALRDILLDLGRGKPINEALERHTLKLVTLEKQFADFAKQRAESLAPAVDWTQPEPGQVDTGDPHALLAWNESHANNFWGLRQLARAWMAQQQWEKAEAPLLKLMTLYPEHADQTSAYALLAHVYRQQAKPEKETAILQQWAQRSADAAPAYQRLMEMAAEKKQWEKVLPQGERYLAVYPMLGRVHQHMGHAHEALNQPHEAIACYQRLLKLDPGDPVDVNFRLARLYRDLDATLAKRYVLEALADAPRFRAGHRLLLEMQEAPEPQEVTP